MEIIWTILVGLVAGVIAKWLHPGKEDMGLIMTTLLGIGGAFFAGYVGQLLGWYQVGQGAGFIASVIGAVVLLWVFTKLRGKKT